VVPVEPEQTTDPLIGRTLSRYRVIERIAAGGMGVVYLCRDIRLERDVAIKILPAGSIADEASRRRFRHEALALSRLNHPHIATIHDFDTSDGMDFLVMEHVGGQALNEMIAEGCVSEAEVSRIGREVLAGLAAAHAQGIVHRDLKPSNVRLTNDGRVKILDFGLARLVRPETASPLSVTASAAEDGGLAGTLQYMAPEQLRGEPADARSDLWAVGLLLYELATGARPWKDSRSGALVAKILQDPPEPPRRVRPDLSPGMERIVLRCLEKDPKNRLSSALELGSELRQLETGANVTSRATRRQLPRIPIAVWITLLVVALASAFLVRSVLVPNAAARPIRSLAVLPLADLSSGGAQEFFADGMTDELITTLAQIGSFKVISRTSVMTFKNRHETLPQIARALHADAVLEGSVARSGDRIRITAQLIQAATDAHLWARTYERDMRDVLALQNDIARSIAQEIRAVLSPAQASRLAQARPVDPEAHTAYLRGLYEWNQRSVTSLQRAMRHFRDALEIDPSYALPYAGLATCYVVLPAYDREHSIDCYRNARAAALKALEMDSTLAEPHAALSGVLSELDWNQAAGEIELKKAIAINPNYASAHQWYADLLSCMGRHREAIAEIHKAADLDPLSRIITTEEGSIYARAGQYERGIKTLRSTIEMDPGFSRAHETLASVYIYPGKFLDSIREFEIADSLLGIRSGAEAEAWYGPQRRAFVEDGVRGLYRQLLRQRLALAKTAYVPPIKIAGCYARLGERDSAFLWLDRACAEKDPYLLRLNVEPNWDNLRTDPRYAALARRLGLPSGS
jgi:eukaryotic-like serine/threonine-protein kinase